MSKISERELNYFNNHLISDFNFEFYKLGCCYEKRDGIEKDLRKGFEFYKISAELAHLKAMEN